MISFLGENKTWLLTITHACNDKIQKCSALPVVSCPSVRLSVRRSVHTGISEIFCYYGWITAGFRTLLLWYRLVYLYLHWQRKTSCHLGSHGTNICPVLKMKRFELQVNFSACWRAWYAWQELACRLTWYGSSRSAWGICIDS